MSNLLSTSPEDRASGNTFKRPDDVNIAGQADNIAIESVGDEVKNQEGISYQSVQDAPVADHSARTNDLLQQILFQLQYMNDLHGDING